MSIINKFYQLRVHEADHTFTTMGPDDVALDMDTEIGYIMEEGSNDKREDDLDNSSDSMYLNFGIFLKSFVTSVTHICPRSCQPILTELFGVRKLFNEREPARVGHEPIKVCQNNRSK